MIAWNSWRGGFSGSGRSLRLIARCVCVARGIYVSRGARGATEEARSNGNPFLKL